MQTNNSSNSTSARSFRRPITAICNFTDQQLENLQHNYHKRSLSTGGIYSLQEVLNEKTRRLTNGLDGDKVVRLILDLSRRSPDGFTTYFDVWRSIYPTHPWRGQSSVRRIMKVLGEVIHHCVANNLPIITALIVRRANRQHSPTAVTNIYKYARNLGCNVGVCAESFVTDQILLAFDLFDNNTTIH